MHRIKMKEVGYVVKCADQWQCDTVRLSASILCNIMSLYLNCCLELKIEILKYMFRFQGQAIDFSM